MESGISASEERPEYATCSTANASAVTAAIRATITLESALAVALVNNKSNSMHSNDNNKNKNDAWKLCFGAAGVYLAYLSYGNIQEDLFRFQAADGSNFRNAWFLQVLESCANIVVGVAGRHVFGGTKGLPIMPFLTSGASQVFAKGFTSLALAAGLSFPVCILAKSAKMVPVMLGQLALGGCSYTLRDYCIAVAIVGGTSLLILGEQDKQKGVSDDVDHANNNDSNSNSNSYAGLAFIMVSLVMDGVTAGLQKRLKKTRPRVARFPHRTIFYCLPT
jgi:UDP-galactose transporter B1